jgi:hypothetical protein
VIFAVKGHTEPQCLRPQGGKLLVEVTEEQLLEIKRGIIFYVFILQPKSSIILSFLPAFIWHFLHQKLNQVTSLSFGRRTVEHNNCPVCKELEMLSCENSTAYRPTVTCCYADVHSSHVPYQRI